METVPTEPVHGIRVRIAMEVPQPIADIFAAVPYLLAFLLAFQGIRVIGPWLVTILGL
jgi:hypothetical protein